jgi:hypothetical protein
MPPDRVRTYIAAARHDLEHGTTSAPELDGAGRHAVVPLRARARLPQRRPLRQPAPPPATANQ